jgi:hypothetical protein
MEFAPDWRVDSLEKLDIAMATIANSGKAVAVELLTQLRPNGQILDNFQLSVNGPQILDLELEFDHRLPVKPLKGLRLRYQY